MQGAKKKVHFVNIKKAYVFGTSERKPVESGIFAAFFLLRTPPGSTFPAARSPNFAREGSY
jgi:hypothetical protein